MDATKTYLETLLLYYEEEVEGEAYFSELAGKFTDAQVRQKLMLLAEVERHAAVSVVPLLDHYDLEPRPAGVLSKMGREGARRTAADWPGLLAGMNRSYPEYLTAFKKLEAMAPEADRARLSFLTEHEVAALKFLELEAHDPDSSTAPLQAYLATDPAQWIAKVG